MYYDEQHQYGIAIISGIRANDYIFAHRGNASQDHDDTVEVYKACSQGLNNVLFVFEDGEFDCPEKFLEAATLYNSGKPALRSDRLFPYYFRSDSPIKGQVKFDKTYPGQNGNASRPIIVVNVDTNGDLSTLIPNHTVIYLGGDHSRNELEFMKRYLCGSIDRETVLLAGTPRERRFAGACWRGDVGNAQSLRDMQNLQPSSPFPNTWITWNQCGPNVGMCMSKDGRYVYWPTTFIPEDGCSVSRIPLSEIPLNCFDADAGFDKNYSHNDLQNVLEGA